jgi:DNA-binding PadR family transcriptional regulator
MYRTCTALKKTDSDPERFLLPGATFHILVSLAGQDLHGYGIMQDILERTAGKMKLSPGILYTAVKRMLEDGLIVEIQQRPDPEQDDERRRYYRLTKLGRDVATAEAARLSLLLQQARDTGLHASGR